MIRERAVAFIAIRALRATYLHRGRARTARQLDRVLGEATNSKASLGITELGRRVHRVG